MLVAIASLARVAAAQVEPERAPVVTKHQITIVESGRVYTPKSAASRFGTVETGEPHGYMFYTAYRVPTIGKAETGHLHMEWRSGLAVAAAAVRGCGSQARRR
jgi:hypothetical protein